jgi:hypothetical protein
VCRDYLPLEVLALCDIYETLLLFRSVSFTGKVVE